ncbi:MAG: U32 family peptidase [Proteobacteria bacterium]|nr:U32 family peptidase [Pseudomonadota bacterium]
MDPKPEILAPAGNRESFLAALAAGADAVYLGLKHFSARMEADNFSVGELAAMRRLASDRGTRMYIAMNVLVKPDELNQAARLLDKLNTYVQPDALIIQDPAMARLARHVGMPCELHLSTLANVSFPMGLIAAQRLRVSRVILPRELSIDEVRAFSQACPPEMGLEVFVHGALCYGVSGRCYWSSFLGGKSGLRGRCVQPCRRTYSLVNQRNRSFSCLDLSLDVLSKLLLQTPRITAWKIEGRKKSANYVHHVVRAYRMFRDHGEDPAARKEAQELLETALSRPTTHYGFLPQKTHPAVGTGEETGSGLLSGRTGRLGGRLSVIPDRDLLAGDRLRIGYEDETGHKVIRVNRATPAGRPVLYSPDRGEPARPDTPAFLVDRREPGLMQEIRGLEAQLRSLGTPEVAASEASVPRVRSISPDGPVRVMHVQRGLPPKNAEGEQGVWLSGEALRQISKKTAHAIWWWLPPVIWPGEEEETLELIQAARKTGARGWVVNAPWQRALLGPLEGREEVWAGPFCNVANGLFIQTLAEWGFSGVMVSPELSKADFTALARQSPLPLGAVISGIWPLCLSRTLARSVPLEKPLKSPQGEVCWVRRHGETYWVFPGWPIRLSSQEKALAGAGYQLFVHLHEPWPRTVPQPSRTTTVNWNLRLL